MSERGLLLLGYRILRNASPCVRKVGKKEAKTGRGGRFVVLAYFRQAAQAVERGRIRGRGKSTE